MPDVNAFSVLIQILSRDVGKILSSSHGENRVASELIRYQWSVDGRISKYKFVLSATRIDFRLLRDLCSSLINVLNRRRASVEP